MIYKDFRKSEQAVKQSVELKVIWNVMALMSRYCNAWVGNNKLCIIVTNLGYIYICISADGHEFVE